MIPDNSKKRLEQLRQQMAFRAQLQQQYDKEMSGKYTRDMPSFQEWLDKRPQNKAKGGAVHPMGINVASDTKAGLSYADMIVDGHKKYESRNSDTLRPYVGKRVAIVRTGEGKAKAIGEVTIGEPKVVNEKKFRAMEDEHKVPKGSRFDINTPTKHLYPMHDPVRYEEERDVGHGIVSRRVIHKAEGGSVEDDYRSEHTAPSPEFGAPMHDVTRDMYPKDFYGPSGFHIYADYGEQKDRDAYNKVVRVKGKPNEMVSIHRAIPTKVYKEALKKDSPLKHMIRKGDWVAINKDYAKEHGEGVLLGDYKIASMRVPAKHVWTNADSIHEWGYHPDEKATGGIIRKAKGGKVEPTQDEMRLALAKGGSVKEPKSTVKAYKLFRVHKDHPGKLFPLFVDANTPVEMNKWVDAKEGEMSNGKVKSKIGALAYRPGWHAGDLPIATHIGEKSDPSLTAPDRRPANHAWAEVEMPNDVDWQTEANKRGTNAQGKLVPVKAHITDQIPKGGHYRYKTNPNMTGNWLIGGSMKVNKVLSDAEVERINKKAGMADLPRTEPFAKKTFGFAHGGSASGCIAPEEWKAEEYVNHKADGGRVEPTQDEMRLALTKRHGLYSPLEKAAIEMPRTKGTGAEFMTELSKRPGYKAEEIADRRIPIPEGKMTKAQFLEHLKKHSLPPLEEKVLGIGDEETDDQAWERTAREMYGVSVEDLTERQFRNLEGHVDIHRRDPNIEPKYSTYQLPDGRNYREVLLKLPVRRPDASKYTDPKKYDADMRAYNAQGQDDFVSSHWRNDPNVLAHLRLSDREGPNGEKLLHVEEVQSDWHQDGRDKGYQKPKEQLIQETKQKHERLLQEHEDKLKEKRNALFDEFKSIKNQLRSMPIGASDLATQLRARELDIAKEFKALDEVQPPEMPRIRNEGVPDAPFKKSWHEMALKHALHHAAKNGYQGMLITPGAEQADRYKLSKHIDELHYNPETHRLIASKGGRRLVDEQSVPPEQLPTHIGKEATEKIMAQEPNVNGLRSLTGEKLQIGGEGMKGFYDKMIPSYLNKLGKPYGVKVGVHPIEVQGEPRDHQEHRQALTDAGLDVSSYFNLPQQQRAKFDYKTKQIPLHHFPITEPMRENILKEGLPQYMRGGVVHKAEGGAVLPIEQIKAQMMNKFKGLSQLQSIGAEEAPSLGVKAYVPTIGRPDNGQMPVGGIDTKQGDLPVGGIDMSTQQAGQQLMPNAPPAPAGMQQGMNQVPQGDKIPTMDGTGMPPTPNANPNQMGSNILSMTPQGQAMAAMKPQGLAKGGEVKMARGGMPFAIKPQQELPKAPSEFTPYDDSKPSIPSLAKAFDEAIAHHLSLPNEDRLINSQRAAMQVAHHIGMTSSGKPKDLLGQNEKLLKSGKGIEGQEPVKLPDGRGVETTGLALAPAYEEGNFNTCPNHHSCKAECLGKTSGNYFKLGGGQDLSEFKGPRLNSLLKTNAFLRDPHALAVKLYDEIDSAKQMAAANGNHLGVRLNVLSDINPRVHKAIIEAHPDVTFYDYTKNNTNPIAPNHHYTYSSTGVSQPGVDNPHTNWKQMRRRLDQGDNVAMAFSHKDHLPTEVHDQETGKKYKVIDGDTHDFRPLDLVGEGEDGVIVGLKNKKATGKMDEAHIDSKGFFLHYDPQLKMSTNAKGQPVYARTASNRISEKTGKPMLGETIPQNRTVNIQPQTRGMIPLTNDGEKQ